MKSVIYHKNCNDGIMSAYLMFVLFKQLNEQAEFIPDNYDNIEFPKVKGQQLFILDYSYSPEILNSLRDSGRFSEIVMLDHHETTADNYGGYKRYKSTSINCDCNCLIDINKNKSGAGLTYQWICENYPFSFVAESAHIKRCVELVQDRDLWNFHYKETKAFHSLLSKYRDSVETANTLLLKSTTELNELLIKEQSILEYKESLFNNIAKLAKDIQFQGYKVPIVNCPSQFASDIGEILYKDKPFAIMYVTSVDKVIISLRSDKAIGVNVKEIAERFGGGGHIPAAGFAIPIEKITDLMNGNL